MNDIARGQMSGILGKFAPRDGKELKAARAIRRGRRATITSRR
jgi:hypothetical protein